MTTKLNYSLQLINYNIIIKSPKFFILSNKLLKLILIEVIYKYIITLNPEIIMFYNFYVS